MSEAKADSGDKAPKKSSKLMLIIIAVVLLGGAGGGFFWWKGQQEAKAAEKEKAEKSAKKDSAKEDHADEADDGHGGGGHAEDAEEEEEEEEEPEHEGAGVLSFEPFIVNLADPGGSRYLKADIKLLVTGVDDMKHLAEDQAVVMPIRSVILEHLSQQMADDIITPKGKLALKKALKKKCARLFKGHGKVADVLFAEFVVQF